MTVTHDELDIDESVVRRVRKLLDKAEGTSNPHEAEAFSRKAAEIAALHRIDPERLAATDRSGDLGVRTIPLGRGAYVRARLSLLISIAEAHDVKVVFQSRPDGTVALPAGFVEDLDVVEMLYHSLHQQASTQMASIRRGTGAATQRHRRSFLFGFADRVGELLGEAATHAEQSAPAGGPAGEELALALRERTERVDEFAAEEWGRVRRARPPRALERRGWADGSIAADNADIGRRRVSGTKGLPSGR